MREHEVEADLHDVNDHLGITLQRRRIAEARWHALLPARRRAALLDAVVLRAGSLRALVAVPHA